ncbi:amino acid adenylation domain-containing protein [Tenacibaculum discolor]|uniref:pyridoxal phosphate-dependent decarboxylase family protein n=1 Tax=Tenacibaculum discolor TaxID=361581 RepID=UPI003F79DAF2
MDNIGQKLASSYWLKKVRGAFKVNEFSSKETKLIKETIGIEDLLYFSKLTNKNSLIEYTTLLSIFNGLLCRYFDEERFIYSSKIEEEDVSLLLKFSSIKENTFKEYLQKNKKEVQDVYKYSNYGGEIQEEYNFKKYTTYGFLYTTNISKKKTNSSLPFVLSVKKEKKSLELELCYDSCFTSDHVAVHFLQMFKNWVCNLESLIDKCVKDISIITDTEKDQLLEVFNNTEKDHFRDKTIVELFENQVSNAPQNIAVLFDEKEITYQELNERANQLANYLRLEHKISQGDLVGVKLERNEDLLIGILGTLKAGATYVPIDINYPKQRINYIEKDSNSRIVIDKSFVGEFVKEKDKYAKENLVKVNTPDNLAYIIYTSGTTGNPKGVMISHANAVAMIHWSQQEFNQNSFNVVYAVTSHCFDLSVYEMFYPLSIGKPIRILNDALEIKSALNSDTKVLINTVPSSMRSLLDNSIKIENISVINLAGEPFPIDLANRLIKTKAEIRNLYGPSEDTTYSTIYKLNKSKVYTGSIPIGKPIANTQAYVLDENLEPLPVGVIGKLYLSGEGITKGYINRPDLTDEKYIKNPFLLEKKMYNTGDLVRWTPQGLLEYFGRDDKQVKLRGYRIELGEIEYKITEYSSDVIEAVVRVKEVDGVDVLVCYYTSRVGIDKTSLREYLISCLPKYMVPTYFLKLKSIPLTPNGKLNINELPEVFSKEVIRKEFVAPRNHIEKKLVSIWEEVINVKNIGIKDDFFELGGHSLMIGQVINQIYKQLNCSITHKEFFDASTIEKIGKVLKKETYIPFPKAKESTYYPLTPSQRSIWVSSQLEQSNMAYNMSGAVYLKGNLDVDKFKKALKLLINKYEILRTSFKSNELGEVYQYVNEVYDLGLLIQDLDFSNKTKEELDEYLIKEQNKPFNLTESPLMRSHLLKIEDEVYVYSLFIHHIIGDGWSIELLMSEVITIYNKLLSNKEYKEERLSIQYKDYSVWLKSQLKEKAYKASEIYWLNKFETNVPVLNLPSNKTRPKRQTHNGSTFRYHFSESFLENLKIYSRENSVTLFMTLMSGINALLSRYTNQRDITIGTPVAGREHPDLEGQIGLYLNTLAIRTEFEENVTFKELLQLQKENLLQAYEHQNYPFDELVAKLDLKRDSSRSPLFDIMVILQNQSQLHTIKEDIDIKGITIEEYEIPRNTTKFDISFTFIEKEKLLLDIEYNTDVYELNFIENLVTHLESFITKALNNPEQKVSKINYLSNIQEYKLLHDFNSTSVAYQKNKTIINLFQDQVLKTPNKTAVKYSNKSLSFKEVDELSNKYAFYLRRKYKIETGDRVIVSIEHNQYLLPVLIAVKKLGAIYVPVDPDTPRERVLFIENDSQSRMVIDSDFLKEVNLKEETPEIKIEVPEITNPIEFIIYTSGSTGVPKGVLLSRDSVYNRLNWMWKNYPFLEDEVCCAKTSIGFVDHIWEFFGPLLKGIPLVFYKKIEILDIENFIDSLCEQNISRIVLVPSLLREIISYPELCKSKLKKLKLWISSGEALKEKDVESFYEVMRDEKVRLLNIYGSTELTADATYYDTYDVYNTFKSFKLFDKSLKKEIDKLISLQDSSDKILQNPFDEIVSKQEFNNVNLDVNSTVEEYLELLKSEVLPNVVNINLPKFIGHMTGPVPNLVRELNALVVALNQNQVKIETSSISTMIERQVIGFFHKLIYQNNDDFYKSYVQNPNTSIGVATNGGTISNIMVLNYVLSHLLPEDNGFKGVKKEGLVKALKHYDYEKVVLLGSNRCHYSFGKSLKLLGLGTDSFVGFNYENKSKTEIYEELSRKIEELKSQKTLILAIVGVAGATESGNIDSLKLIGEIAKEHQIHYHVDAAFGGSFLLADEFREKFEGITMADSVAICAHKQMYLPIGLSYSIFKDPSFVLSSENNTNYQARKGSHDLGKFTLEGSKNFSSLILHGVLNILGKEGFAEIIRRNYQNAQQFAEIIRKNNEFELLFEPDLNIVLYRYVPLELKNKREYSNKELESVNEINKQIQKIQFDRGNSFVSYTMLKRFNTIEDVALRTVFMNPFTTVWDLESILNEQKAIAYEIEKRPISKEKTERNKGILIGKPIDNVKVYILDEEDNILPFNVVGEICVSGDCVSEGYLKETTVNSLNKFTNNPFVKGERMFRTGDLGRRLEDGNIEFVGRKDSQIKIRGNRVEVREIENTLLRKEGISQAVVILKDIKDDGKEELVAYFVSSNKENVIDLKLFLKEYLPEYMIPSFFVEVDKIPLMLNGKTDRKALANVKGIILENEVTYVAPKNEIERKLVAIWENVLKRKEIGLEDDFFDLGGHSLKLTLLINKIAKEFKVKIPFEKLFNYSVLKDQVNLIKESNRTKEMPIVPLQEAKNYEMSYAQRSLWLVSQFKEKNLAYNMPVLYKFKGLLDRELLEKAFKNLITNHEILRTVFVEDNDETKQYIIPAKDFLFTIDYIDINTSINNQLELNQYIETIINKPFDLVKGPLLRVNLIKTLEEEHLLLFTMHHIIADEWSFNIIIKEVSQYYNTLLNNQILTKTSLPIQYKDYSYWLKNKINNQEITDSYWRNELKGKLAPLTLMYDNLNPLNASFEGEKLIFEVDKDISLAIKKNIEIFNLTEFTFHLATYTSFLHVLTKENDIVLGVPFAGRDHYDLEDQIGYYVNLLPIRTKFDNENYFTEILHIVNQKVLKALENQMYPMDLLMEDLDFDRRNGGMSFINTGFTWVELDNQEITINENLSISIEPIPNKQAKYDLWIVTNGTRFVIEYRKELFNKDTIELFIERYKVFLKEIVINPNKMLSDYDYSTIKEKELENSKMSIEINF